MNLKNRYAISAALISLSFVLNIAAQQKTITPNDIVDLRDVGDAQISPDGGKVAFVVGLQGGWTGPRKPHIWIVSTDGQSAARPFTVSEQGDSSPRWSPDGRFLAFLSQRTNPFKPQDLSGEEQFAQLVRQFEQQSTQKKTGGSPEPPKKLENEPTTPEADEPPNQIWMMHVNGGEALPLTAVKGSVQNFVWSPDGAMIAFTVRDPLTDEEKSKHDRKDDAVYVDHNNKYARLWLLNFKTGMVKQVISQDINVNDLTWSPDGKQLALLVSKTSRPVDIWYENKIVVVDRDSGKIVRTLVERANVMDMRWSPDGRNIVYGQRSETGISTRPSLISPQGGNYRTLDDNYQGTIWALRWRPDSRELIAESLEGTQAGFIAIDSQTGKTRNLGTVFAEGPQFSISADGQRIAYVGQSFTSPSDIWTMDLGKAPRQLTSLQPQVASWNLGAVREINWKNKKDGKAIYGVLITPPGFNEGKPYPTIVQVHGGPEWAWWSGWLASWHEWGQLLASHGYVVLLPNPRGSDGQGWQFAESVREDWGGMDFADIMSGVDYLIDRKIADPDRLGIGGWSYGGFMTSWSVTHTDRFKAAVVGAAVTDLISFAGTTDITPSFTDVYFGGVPFTRWQVFETHSPLTYLHNCKTPSLILHGEADTRVPVSQGWEFYNGLKMLGVPAEMVTYPREPHGIGERAHQVDLLTRVLAWYDQYLKP